MSDNTDLIIMINNRLERMEAKIDNINIEKVPNRMFMWVIVGAYTVAIGSYGFCFNLYLRIMDNADKIVAMIGKIK